MSNSNSEFILPVDVDITAGLTNAVPIRADSGGYKIHLLNSLQPTDNVILVVNETTGYKVKLKIDDIVICDISPNSHWCGIYNNPFSDKIVYIDAIEPDDPNRTGNHALVCLLIAQ